MQTFLMDNPIMAMAAVIIIVGIVIYIKAGAQQKRNMIRDILEKDLGKCNTPEQLDKLIKDKNKYGKTEIQSNDYAKAIVDYIEEKKFKEYLKVILDTGCDINSTISTYGMSPVFYAIFNDYLEQAKILQENGGDIERTDSDGVNIIGIAASEGVTSPIEFVLQQGWDINIADQRKNTPITYALLKGNTSVADFLIDQGADVNATNSAKETPLIISVKEDMPDFLNYLIAQGADTEIKDSNGRAPIQIAINNKQESIVSALIVCGSVIRVDDVSLAIEVNNYDIVRKIFYAIGAQKDLDKWLYDAVYGQYLNSTAALLDFGAEADGVINNFMTPAILAAMTGNQKLLDIIIPHTSTSPFSKLINYIGLSDGNVGLNLKQLILSEVGGEIIYDSKATPGSLHWEIANREVERALGLSDVKLKDNKNETFSVLFYNKTNLGNLAKTLIVRGSEVNFVKVVNTDSSINIVFKNIPGSKINDWIEQQGFIEDILGVAVEVEQYNNDHILFPELGREKLIIIKESNISAIPANLGLEGEFIKEASVRGIKEIHFGNVLDPKSWKSNASAISKVLNRSIQVVSDGTKIILRDSIESSIPSLLEWDDNKETPVLLQTVENNGNTDYFYSYSHDRDLNKWKEASRKVSFKTLFNEPDKVYKLDIYDKSNVDLYDASFSTEQMIVLHEYSAIPNKDELMSFEPKAVIKDKDVFWGYGTGSKKYYTSIAELPHMMIIGSSGSGKSNFINGIIMSLLNNIGDIQKMYLVDLKSGIEFNRYKDLNPEKISVFSKGTSPSKFLASLQEVEAQMYLREEYMVKNNIIKIDDDPIFIIIDEYAQIQLMHARGEEIMAKDEIVDTLIRIGTRARSANIKLIVQTQDPRAVEDELKVHLMSRALLKTSKESDMAFTLQNEDLAIEMGIKHTQFDKGRFVFEDYNDGNTKLEELQFPYIDPEKKYHLQFDMSQRSNSRLNLDQFSEHVASEYPYLAHTEILNGSAVGTSISVSKSEISEAPVSDDSSPFDFNSLLSANETESVNEVDEEDEQEIREINRLQSESLDILKDLLEE